MFRKKGNQGHIRGPHNIPTLRNLHIAHVALLLHIEQGDGVCVPKEQHPRPGVEYLVAVGDGQLFGHLILQILDHKRVRFVQNSKPELKYFC